MAAVSPYNGASGDPLCSPVSPYSSGPASFSSDYGSCEGYLVLTFSKSNKSEPKPSVTAASDVDTVKDENQNGQIQPRDVTAPLSVIPTTSPHRPARISRLAAMAAGVDVSQLTSVSIGPASAAASAASSAGSCSSSAVSLSSSSSVHTLSCDYVRRFTYPDGDTHYDWLSCPLTEMQGKGDNAARPTSTKPISLAAVPRKPFLVYDSSLPSSSTSASRRPRFLTSASPSASASACSSSSTRRHLTSRKMLRCEECGKYYGNEYSLHHHICLRRKDVWKKGDVPTELVDGQLTYFCPVCSKPFKWLGNLTRHYYVHTGQRFFKCDICHKEFFSAYQVRRHMNSHTGVRFQCTVCDKPFTCKYACAWHARQHLKEQQQA
uniref:C2H2-type domain-containing protein n=1 Tax=Mesocestoides corti TaxID=53468 RepID=A0A5K3F142_MESCO